MAVALLLSASAILEAPVVRPAQVTTKVSPSATTARTSKE